MINKEKYKKNEFQAYILENNKKISFLSKNRNIYDNLNEKYLNYFSIILKGISKRKLIYIEYLSKHNKKTSIKKLEKFGFSKLFIKYEILLLFVYFYKYNCDRNVYYKLIKIVEFYFQNNQILEDEDILEIFYYNLIIFLLDLDSNKNINKNISFFYNISLNVFIKTIITNFKKLKIDILINIFDSIYNLLIEKKKILFLLRTKDDINNISLIKINEIKYLSNTSENKDEFIKLKNNINEIINLIYGFNINKNYNDYLLTNIKNSFSELKKNYSKEKIINSLHELYNQINSLNDIFLHEERIFKGNKNDIFMPKRYFVFNKSNKSGINYNPKIPLIENNFTLIFSFKQYESEINKVYPLFSLYTEKNIIFGIYLKNKKILIHFLDNYIEIGDKEIILNQSYLIVIEFKKKDFVQIYINNAEPKKINCGNFKNKQYTSVALGYLPNDLIINNKFKDFINNYIGIIGTTLFFNRIFEEQEFINYLFNLNGSYDILINLNEYTYIYNDTYNQEIYLLNQNIIDYFMNISKKIDESIIFIISPLSLINDYQIRDFNSNDEYNNINFIENIFGKNNKDKNYFADIFSTLDIPLPFTGATYPKNQISSLINFIQNDGFYLVTLYLEYFYNILKMLLSLNVQNEDNNSDTSTIYYNINKCLCPLLYVLANIIKNCSNIIYYYKDSLDTLGFSFYKIFKILIHQTPLNSELLLNLKEFLIKLNRIFVKTKEKYSQKVVINFINKILFLILDKSVFNLKNYKEFNDYLSIFKIVLKNNEYLIDSKILDLILNFAFLLDKKNADKIDEYKIISKEYKNVLKIFIIQINTIELHCEYIDKVFNNQEINFLIKYKLMKLYYISNNIKYVYNQNSNYDQKEKINSFFGKFRRNKDNKIYNILLKEKLYNEYKNQFNYLLNINNYIEIEDKKYYELIKCILMQLIYEQSVLIIPSKLEINYLDANLLLSDIQISFFKYDEINKIKDNNKQKKIFSRKNFYSFSIDDNTELIEGIFDDKKLQDSDSYTVIRKTEKRKTERQDFNKISMTFKKDNKLILEEKENKNIKIYGLFDELLFYEDNDIFKEDIEISSYMFKSLFACFYDTWNKVDKLKFIKDINDNSYERFNMCINDFNRFKLQLFFQYIQLLEIVKESDIYEIIMRLIYSFIKQIIDKYKSNQNDIDSRRVFIHLFENKKIMNYLLNSFFENNDDKLIKNTELKLFIESSIENINNIVLFFHPKPFLFSYIKNCIKNYKKYVIEIIKKLSEFIINDFKNNKENNNITICFYYFNRIKFINSIKNYFQNYKNNSQKLLCENKYQLFNTIINLIEEFTKNDIIFDSKIYTFNIDSVLYIFNPNKNDTYNEEEKRKDKKYIKSIQLTNTQIINNEGLYIILIELSLNMIYLLWTVKESFLHYVTKIHVKKFISKISEIFFLKNHLISYYLDAHNEYFTYNQIKKHTNLIRSLPKDINELIEKYSTINKENNSYFIKNPYIKDNRIMSVIVFLLFMNYRCRILNFENNNSFSFDKDGDQKQKIFDNFVKKAFAEIVAIYQNINKIKEDEKIKLFFTKEIKSNKNNLIKSFHQNYYLYLLDMIKKNKINFISDHLINEIEKKFLKEIEEEEIIKNNNLIEGKNKDINSKKNKDSYNINNENFKENKNETQNKIRENENKEFKEQFLIIEQITFNNNSINDNLDLPDNNINNEYHEYKDNYNIEFTNYFIDAKYPILCTKRDLILKNFGYFFYQDYFLDKDFINLKKIFMIKFPPSEEKNNYNNFEMQMSLKYPSTIKNYSNWDIYYPRIFLRPDKHFFNNEFYEVGHDFFKAFTNKNNKPNFEYGHGLLNQTNFELFDINNEDIIDDLNYGVDNSIPCYETELLAPNNNYMGLIALKEKFFVYQTNMDFDLKKYQDDKKYILSSKKEEIIQIPKQIIIPYQYINQIIKRKFIFFNQSFEIFLHNGKSYFFNLYQEKICDKFFNEIEKIKNNDKNNYEFEIIKDSYDYFFKKKYTSFWLDKKISTLEYLLQVNKFSGRTYNDLSQYLIIPWTLKDYSDINDKKNIREFSLPMSAQEKENLEIIKNNYEIDNEPNKSYFKCHYSNSSYVIIYLFRINPFTNNQIKLQSGKFDSPQRQVIGFQELCSIFKENKETCELIPEYFYLIECFLNLNYNFFGVLEKKKMSIVNNINLSKDFNSLLELFLFHQNLINSDEISSNIHKWIDNIFGENQFTDKKNVINSYPFECYEQNMRKLVQNKIKELEKNEEENKNVAEEIKDIKTCILPTYLLGQCPGQIFHKSHPSYSAKNNENNYSKILVKNEIKVLSYNDFIYMKENNYNDNYENNYFYIVTKQEILVFNKNIKIISNLCINNIKKTYNIFDSNYISAKNKENQNDNSYNILYYNQYFYKRLIFDIENCKFFFIGGYLDNSFKIYFKNKDKCISYTYITNSLVTCLKYMKNTKFFFTGHINGRINKWEYNIIEKGKDIYIYCINLSSVIAHKSGVSIIEIHDKLQLLLSSSNKDGIIFIRKIYDYELLSAIKFNNITKQIMDIEFDKEYFIITYNYKKIIDNTIQKIVTYSVNSIKLSEIKIFKEDNNESNLNDYYILPLSIQKNNDNIFMISKKKFNIINITGKNKTELIPIDENILKLMNKGESIINTKKSDCLEYFIQKLNNSLIVSYFYDFNNHLLFCLFKGGHLFRINLHPKDNLEETM